MGACNRRNPAVKAGAVTPTPGVAFQTDLGPYWVEAKSGLTHQMSRTFVQWNLNKDAHALTEKISIRINR
ncbi:hypothetical protein [Phenylobacterium sp.]|uniref:hypothetical protein n=1 Tax=Phenylobacterium sp. TaxID=1871053 RepID=UPI002F40A457